MRLWKVNGGSISSATARSPLHVQHLTAYRICSAPICRISHRTGGTEGCAYVVALTLPTGDYSFCFKKVEESTEWKPCLEALHGGFPRASSGALATIENKIHWHVEFRCLSNPVLLCKFSVIKKCCSDDCGLCRSHRTQREIAQGPRYLLYIRKQGLCRISGHVGFAAGRMAMSPHCMK